MQYNCKYTSPSRIPTSKYWVNSSRRHWPLHRCKYSTCVLKEKEPSPLKSLKVVDQFTYLSSNVLYAESDVIICLMKVWNAIERLLIIWKSGLSDKIKRNFFLAVPVSILLYRCTTWMLTKHRQKPKWGTTQECYMLSWTNPGGNTLTKQQLYSHLPLISQTIQVGQTRHARYCWKSKDKLISDVLL